MWCFKFHLLFGVCQIFAIFLLLSLFLSFNDICHEIFCMFFCFCFFNILRIGKKEVFLSFNIQCNFIECGAHYQLESKSLSHSLFLRPWNLFMFFKFLIAKLKFLTSLFCLLFFRNKKGMVLGTTKAEKGHYFKGEMHYYVK